jgi:hypothetical protein
MTTHTFTPKPTPDLTLDPIKEITAVYTAHTESGGSYGVESTTDVTDFINPVTGLVVTSAFLEANYTEVI